jgi:hypothetical protein
MVLSRLWPKVKNITSTGVLRGLDKFNEDRFSGGVLEGGDIRAF